MSYSCDLKVASYLIVAIVCVGVTWVQHVCGHSGGTGVQGATGDERVSMSELSHSKRISQKGRGMLRYILQRLCGDFGVDNNRDSLLQRIVPAAPINQTGSR